MRLWHCYFVTSCCPTSDLFTQTKLLLDHKNKPLNVPCNKPGYCRSDWRVKCTEEGWSYNSELPASWSWSLPCAMTCALQHTHSLTTSVSEPSVQLKSYLQLYLDPTETREIKCTSYLSPSVQACTDRPHLQAYLNARGLLLSAIIATALPRRRDQSETMWPRWSRDPAADRRRRGPSWWGGQDKQACGGFEWVTWPDCAEAAEAGTF